ncbi:deoxyribose-phosphate aldolase [Miniimonas arenae]|uniref:Deoxyribose-phosphate aldolase n=1 Tax=Miniimonas arenae TaxID=676201 RepID=A0A5C5B9J8_9MICO|nr:deoxyribose-phosphate aldolase [Miniimonas arenae]TNU73381.1 deoxyribose-phosphate aldolase [Miniimonas arenae]
MTRTDAEIARLALETMDLTDLSDDATLEGALALAQRAAEHGTAAVCVWPRFVAASAQALDGTGVRVATVVNFPGGADAADDVAALTRQAVADGADEIDVVLPYRAFLAGDVAGAAAVLDATREAAGDSDVKVIIESGELRETDAIEAAAGLAVEHGAQFVKTSTGKSPVSATPEAARAILGVLADLSDGVEPVGFKASGGIRTVADARVYLELADEIMGADWVSPSTFRFGASGLLDDVLRVLGAESESGDGGESGPGSGPGSDADAPAGSSY